MKALVTGACGGIGRALVDRLEREGYEVEGLDLLDGFDVGDPDAWEGVGAVDVACLNAGVLTGAADPREVSVDAYRRAVSVNVDGVVLGVRRLARVMDGGAIVVTASLAGLTAMPSDPVFACTYGVSTWGCPGRPCSRRRLSSRSSGSRPNPMRTA